MSTRTPAATPPDHPAVAVPADGPAAARPAAAWADGARPAGVEALAAHLTALSDADVAALLAARPDLLRPASSSFTTLAARAGARASVETALTDLGTVALTVAEAVVATGCQDPQVLAPALLLDPGTVADQLERLHRLVLVIAAGPVHGLVEALGPHPLGLAPAGGDEAIGEPGAASPPDPAAPGTHPGAEPGTQGPVLPPPLEVLHAQAQLPPDSLAVLDALTWGPPVGTVRAGGQAPGAQALVERGWLRRTSDATGRTRLILPRDVALALRGGRLLREAPTAPDPAGLPVQDPAATADESSRAAEELVRLVGALLDEWGREPGPVLRTGGVGVRATARTADALGLDPATTASVVELAAGAGLLGLDEAGAAWTPSREAAHWRGAPLPEQWAALAAPWCVSARTPWLVGTRGDDGALRPVLGDDVEAGWARDLRRRVLVLLDSLPQGAVVDPTWVRAALTFARPRRVVPEGAVTGVLTQARLLGVTGGGALSRAGRVLARALREGSLPTDGTDSADVAGTAHDGVEAGAQVLTALEHALAEDLAEPTALLLVQSDLTAIVPGRPEPGLARLLERASTVESRGGALTVRFTADSVRTALDSGLGAQELRTALERYAPSPLPTTLTVLIDDAARHHGAVRVREVASLLRVPDPAAAAGLLADARLAGLGLDEVAPGVLTSTAGAGQVLRELRAAGLAPVLEGADGTLLLSAEATAGRRGAADPPPSRPGAAAQAVRRRRPTARELAVMVGRLRAGERAHRAQAPGAVATDPVHALAVLRQAQASRSRVRLSLAGADGAVQERTVRVLAVEAGRVRLADLVRETELTVAAHRIVSVEEE